ncbi:MAG TPA: thiamine diphosphokinase [Candidatus Saccharimonadales bacterium]
MKGQPGQAVIFLNGDLSDMSRVKPYVDDRTLLIGCDGGTRYILALGYKPGAIIGDFDSLEGLTGDVIERLKHSGEVSTDINGTAYVRYPADKDQTDSELSIRYAAEHGCRRIILTGALGTRLDHLLGNVLLLAKDEFSELDIKIIEGSQEIYLIRWPARINGTPGDIISFIPIAGSAQVSRTTGLKYDLSRYDLSPQSNHGLSNVLTAPVARVDLKTGILLVIHDRQDKP